MDRIGLVRKAVEQHLGDIRDLLAMQLLFPPDHLVVTIEKEIRDLYTYPERLQTSHRDEWKAVAVKALHRNAFSGHGQTDQENLKDYLRNLQEVAIIQCKADNPDLFRSLEEVMAIEQSANTVFLPDARRKNVSRLIWPERR